MAGRKEMRARIRRLQTRHFEEAACAIKRREKGMEPNTVQYSARIIGVWAYSGGFACPVNRKTEIKQTTR
ncbi:MAG: hypothetical protein KHY76_09790 [Butyricicoccus pullicaecorum]|nr:hypothetical protein [Butyricicoccus pullicaecorum]